MAYTNQEARELVVKAGLKLVELGLVARTWGNISARISDEQFIITPSGRPYETITPDQTVVVNISDWKYEGDIVPSDEIGVHAYIYGLHPEVNFVIHTHQQKACIISSTDLPYILVPEKFKDILGEVVPLSGYGLPSTKKLCKQVRKAVAEFHESKAVIMKHHGTACFGKDYDEAFNIAQTLEELCRIAIHNNYLNKSNSIHFHSKEMRNYYLSQINPELQMPNDISDLGSSVRKDDSFILTMKSGRTYNVSLNTLDIENNVPNVAKIHKEIYKTTKANFITHLAEPYTVAVSVVGKPIIPYLDDFSQIVGTSIRVSNWNLQDMSISSKNIAYSLNGRNAVLIKNLGAICIAQYERDVAAINSVMEKGCECEIGVKLFESGKPIKCIDRFLMRTVYTHKYSKQANK